MDKKERFRQGLARMREKAAGNYNHITVSDIIGCFPGLELTKEQIRLIYRYAEEEHIVIEDYQPRDTRSVTLGEPKLTGEEKAYFRMYLEDLRSVVPCEPEEAELLAERLIGGDDAVIGRLTEGHLSLVLEIARRHAGKGMLIGDLVQEGNVELMQALNDLLSGSSVLLTGGLTEYLTGRVDRAMKQSLAALTGHKKAGERLAQEANRLLAATMDFEEEYGREATLSELAEKVKLPEDKVKELIQISLDAAALGDKADREEGDGPNA